MRPKQRKITEVLMQCRSFRCAWIGTVGECDCDADYPKVEDDGRLRCPKCGEIVSQIGQG